MTPGHFGLHMAINKEETNLKMGGGRRVGSYLLAELINPKYQRENAVLPQNRNRWKCTNHKAFQTTQNKPIENYN